jgi:cell wall assembly regulator SMI1
MGQVTDAWSAIERWMARHAPRSAELLAGPADPAEIAAAEARLRVAFPPELVESLRRHDGLSRWGWDNVFPGQPPLQVAQIVAHHEMCMDIAGDGDGREPAEEGREPWWHPLWIPFAEIDGDAQIIDLRPGPGHGRLGWSYHDDRGTFRDAWPSLGAYLAATADALLHGGGTSRYADGGRYCFPYLTPEDTLWWAPPGTSDLDGEPLRPAPVGLT